MLLGLLEDRESLDDVLLSPVDELRCTLLVARRLVVIQRETSGLTLSRSSSDLDTLRLKQWLLIDLAFRRLLTDLLQGCIGVDD